MEENNTSPVEAEQREAAINSLEAAFEAHEAGAPAENIAPEDETNYDPPEGKPDEFKEWFFSKDFIDEIITNAIAWILEQGNVRAFNALFSKKYKKLNPDDIKIDKEDKIIITKGMHAMLPKFFAWVKTLPVPVLTLLALEYGIWQDMKENAVPIDKEEPEDDDDEEEPEPQRKTKSKKQATKKAHKHTEKHEQQAKPAEAIIKKPNLVPMEIVVPDYGEEVLEVKIRDFIKRPGDIVKYNEGIVTILTDTGKFDIIKSPRDGTLVKQICKENDLVPIGLPVAMVA